MRISDCFMEIIAYAAFVVRTDSSGQPPFEQVKATMQRLIAQSESQLAQSQVSHEDYQLARFAVFAWVDEDCELRISVQSFSVCRILRSRVKCSSTRLLPAWPILDLLESSLINPYILFIASFTLPTGTIYPVAPSITASLDPPASVATTGICI